MYILYLFSVASDDYYPLNETLQFSVNQTRVCTNISIIDDLTVEQKESFYISLERPADLNNRITISYASGEVVISNDDGESDVMVCTT